MNNVGFKDYLEGYKNITDQMEQLNVAEARKRLAEIPGEIETWEEVLGEDTIEGKTPEEAAAARSNSEDAVAEISALLAEQAEMERRVEQYRTLDNYRSNVENNFHNYHHSTRDTFEQGKASIEAKLSGVATRTAIQAKLDDIDKQVAEFNSEYREAARELYAMKERVASMAAAAPTAAVANEAEEAAEKIAEEADKAMETASDIEKDAAKAEEENKKAASELEARLEQVRVDDKENRKNGEIRWARGYTEEQIQDAIERGIDEPSGPEYEQWLLEVVPLGDTNEPGVLYKKIEEEKAPEIRWPAGYTEEQILDAIGKGIDKPDGPEFEQWKAETVPLGDKNEPGVLYTGEPFEPTTPTGPTTPPGGGDGDGGSGDGGSDGGTGSDDEDKGLDDGDTPPGGGDGGDDGDSGDGADEDDEDLDDEDDLTEDTPDLPAEEEGYEVNFTEKAPGINHFQKNTNSAGARQVIKKRKASIIRTAGIGIAGVIAANALWGVPIATAALAGAIIVGGTQLAKAAERVIKEKIQTARLRGLADDLSSEEFDIRTVYDYDAGTVDFAKAIVNEDGTIKYEAIRNPEELYAVAEAAGMSREELDEAFAKATSARWVATPGVSRDGLEVSDIANNGLAGLYDQAGGLKITNPQDRDESIRHITECGISKVQSNVDNLKGVLENKKAYNLSETQEELIEEAIRKQEAIIARRGFRAALAKNGPLAAMGYGLGSVLNHLPVFGKDLGSALQDKALADREIPEEIPEMTPEEIEEVEEVERSVDEADLDAEEAEMAEERRRFIEEKFGDRSGSTTGGEGTEGSETGDSADTDVEEVAEEITTTTTTGGEGTEGSETGEGADTDVEEVAEEITTTTGMPTGEGSTGTTDAEKDERMEEDLFEDDLSSETPSFKPLAETVEHVERPTATPESKIPDRAAFVEKMSNCSDAMLDIVVQTMRNNGMSEEFINGILTEAGRMPEMGTDKSMGM